MIFLLILFLHFKITFHILVRFTITAIYCLDRLGVTKF